MSTYVSGRQDDYFDEPLKFKPERFNRDLNTVKNYTYFPFSLGARNCIGQNFAQVKSFFSFIYNLTVFVISNMEQF